MPNLENANITEAKTVKPKGEIWRSYDVTDGLAAGAACLYQDATGYLWIGTNGGGVSVFDGHQFTTYTTADGLAHNMVVSICRDGGGRLWFGTGGWFNIPGGGVSVFDGHQFTTYTTADGLAHNTVWAICNDAQGRLWFGTWGMLITSAVFSAVNSIKKASTAGYCPFWWILTVRYGLGRTEMVCIVMIPLKLYGIRRLNDSR